MRWSPLSARPDDATPLDGAGAPPKESLGYQAGFICGLVRGDAADGGTAVESDAWIRADGYLDDVPLTEAVRWPEAPTDDWFRGFLAGAFGAVGRTDRGAVTFSSGDLAYLRRIAEALVRLGLAARGPEPLRPGSIGRVETERSATTASPATGTRISIWISGTTSRPHVVGKVGRGSLSLSPPALPWSARPSSG